MLHYQRQWSVRTTSRHQTRKIYCARIQIKVTDFLASTGALGVKMSWIHLSVIVLKFLSKGLSKGENQGTAGTLIEIQHDSQDDPQVDPHDDS